MNALALHELADIMEHAFSGRKSMIAKKRGWKVRVAQNKEPTILFDRRRRIGLLWDLLVVALIILFVFALLAGVR